MHMIRILLRFVVVLQWPILSTPTRVTSLALRQSYDLVPVVQPWQLGANKPNDFHESDDMRTLVPEAGISCKDK